MYIILKYIYIYILLNDSLKYDSALAGCIFKFNFKLNMFNLAHIEIYNSELLVGGSN